MCSRSASRRWRAASAALATSSGQAAQTLAILNIANAGDEIVSTTSLYGGTYNQFEHTLPKLGIKVNFCEPTPEGVRKAITPKTKLVYSETIGNPDLLTLDIQGVADEAHDAGVPLMIDNTLPTPYLVRPLEHGADIVVHSLTKFIGGHGTSIGGIIVDGGIVRLEGVGQVPRLHRARSELPRAGLRRRLQRRELRRQHRLHHQGPRARPARHRRIDQPVQLLPLPARDRNAAAADGAPQPERDGGRPLPDASIRRSTG